VEEALEHPWASDGADDGLRAFAARLAQAAPAPGRSFSNRLARHVIAEAAHQARSSKAGRTALSPRLGLLLATVAALSVGIGVAMPAFGDGTLKRVKPREVTAPPSISEGAAIGQKVAELTWTEPLELSRRVGIAVYVPSYLPEGCQTWGSWSYNAAPIPPSVYLQYSCVVIGTKLGSGVGYPVPAGSLTEISVSGQPALYQSSVWVTDPRTNQQLQQDAQTIFLERGGSIVTVVAVRQIGKEELIKVAESLRPVSAR